MAGLESRPDMLTGSERDNASSLLIGKLAEAPSTRWRELAEVLDEPEGQQKDGEQPVMYLYRPFETEIVLSGKSFTVRFSHVDVAHIMSDRIRNREVFKFAVVRKSFGLMEKQATILRVREGGAGWEEAQALYQRLQSESSEMKVDLRPHRRRFGGRLAGEFNQAFRADPGWQTSK